MNTEYGNRFYSAHKYGGKSEKNLTKTMIGLSPEVRTDIKNRLIEIEKNIETIKKNYEDIKPVYIQYPQLDKFNDNAKLLNYWFLWRRYLNPFISLGGPLILWIIMMYLYNYIRGISCNTNWILKSVCKFIFGVSSFENLSIMSGIIVVISFGFFVMGAKHSIGESLEMVSLNNNMETLNNFMENTRMEYEDLIVLAHTGKIEGGLRNCENVSGYGNIAAHIRNVVSRFDLLEATVGRIDVCLSRCEKIIEKKIASANGSK